MPVSAVPNSGLPGPDSRDEKAPLLCGRLRHGFAGPPGGLADQRTVPDGKVPQRAATLRRLLPPAGSGPAVEVGACHAGSVLGEFVLGDHDRDCWPVLDSGLGDGPVPAVHLVQDAVEAPRHVLVAALVRDSELDRCAQLRVRTPRTKSQQLSCRHRRKLFSRWSGGLRRHRS